MKKHLKKSLVVLACTAMCIQSPAAVLAKDVPKSDAGLEIAVQALTTAQWKKDSTGWWYQNADGSYPKNQWQLIKGQWYHFNASGYMQTGWQKIGGSWYYLKSGGEMATGWQKIGSTWYYLKSGGEMATGWQKIGGSWYYLKSGGEMATGWQKIGGTWYYLKSGGAMATGWQKIGSTWYYLRSNGSMVENQWEQIGENWYYFTSGGAMQHDTWIGDRYVDSDGVWQPDVHQAQFKMLDTEFGGFWFYFDESDNMVTGWKKIDGSWYYFREQEGTLQGAMCADGMFPINDKYYNFGADGKMQTGWKQGEEWYYFDPDTGAAVRGWKELNHKKYYFTESDVRPYMVTGRCSIDGEEYCFNSDGSMHTGWYTEINKWAADGSDCIDLLYFDPDGKAHKNWLTVDGKTYWADEKGYIAHSYPDRYESIAIREIDGYYYGFDENGVMLTGYQRSVDKRTGKTRDYFFDEQGHWDQKKTGWIEIDGQKYYMLNGAMLVDTRYEIDGEEYCFNSDGSMHTGWYTEIHKWADDGSDSIQWMYFDPDGKLHKNWLTVDGKTYWADKYGYIVHSYPERYETITIHGIDGYDYGFDENGVMLTGYQRSLDKKTGRITEYFFDEQGHRELRKTGWIEIDGQKHYLESGTMLVDTYYIIDDVLYYFDENGVATVESY